MKKNLNFTLLFSALLFFFLSIESLQAQTWEPTNGPYGGPVQCFAENDSYLFAGSSGGVFAKGVFRSADHGANWTTVNNGLSNVGMGKDIYALAVSGSYIVASTGQGIYRTADNGDNWSVCDYSGTYVPNAFYSIGSDLLAGGSSGLYVSTDNGLTWASQNEGFQGISPPSVPEIQSFVMNGTTLYTGTNQKGIFRSTNNGLTWTTVNGGLGTPSQLSQRNFNSLVFENGDIFAGTFGQGVFRLRDNGNNWTNEVNGLPNFQSKYIRSILIKDSYVYITTLTGLYRSELAGTISWTLQDITPSDLNLVKLFGSGSDIFASTERGVCISTDNTATWTTSFDGMLGLNATVYSAGGTDLFAATSGVGNGYFYRSSDFGESWDMGNMVGAPYPFNGYLFLWKAEGIFRSADNGETWDLIYDFGGLCYFHSMGSTLFATITCCETIYYSNDNGISWTPSTLLDLGGFWGNNILDLTNDGTTLYAGTLNIGVLKSIDNGVNWTTCNTAMGNIPIRAMATDTTYIYAGTSNFYEDPNLQAVGIYRSADNGTTWTLVNNGLGNLDIGSLVINGNDIYAGTKSGIYKSSNNGDNWIPMNDGFTVSPNTTSMVVSGNYLFANNFAPSLGAPIYRRALSGSVPEQPDEIVGTATPCIGSNQTYSVTNVPGVTYAWQVPSDWTILSGNGTNSINVTIGVQAGAVLVTPSNGWGSGPTQFLAVVPTTAVEAEVSIAADQDIFCSGSTAIITAMPVEGGETPVYQWFVNGIENEETGSVLTYIPTNNDEVYTLLTSSLSCVTNNPVQSNTLQLQVTEAIDVIASIDVDKNNVCAGDVMTFTATTTNGGEQPEYSWYVNEAVAGENAPIFSYTPENGDIVSLVFTSSEWCVSQNPVTSNAIVAIVKPLPDVSWNYTDPTTVCIEDWGPITLTGGLPEGGIYSGDGVSGNIFNQAVAGAGNHVISYTYTNADFCSNQVSIEFTVDECLGISEATSRLLVYPNPAINNMTIKLMDNQTILDITLINNMGITVYENHDVKSMGTVIIPVQHIKAGNYTIKVTGNNETVIKSVIIE
ncbi:MAG: T9SS type A sorting domain-containing protein [Bacteroidales bacterium]|nr:T9SS type A sorting domain-containing protein [Bacteroidales bacterium]